MENTGLHWERAGMREFVSDGFIWHVLIETKNFSLTTFLNYYNYSTSQLMLPVAATFTVSAGVSLEAGHRQYTAV